LQVRRCCDFVGIVIEKPPAQRLEPERDREDASPRDGRLNFAYSVQVEQGVALANAAGGTMNKSKRPNIILIVTDDQGYGDMSCVPGSFVQTPNLDRIASTGIRFNDFYSNSPVCSPSRAALLSGRYPGNAGVRSILHGHRQATGLAADVPTVSSICKANGYQTALTGKWHLGLAPGCRPADHGFDEFFGFMAGCVDYYSHIFYWGMADGKTNPTHDLWDNDREVWQDGKYITHLITERAVGWIDQACRRDAPFLSVVAYNAPHYPMHAPPEYLERFSHLPWDRRIMAAMIAAMDEGVGAILDTLDRNNVADDTIIFFMSDNGPSREARNWLDGTADPYYGGTTGGLKGHKFSLYDGGIRVPALLRWPRGLPAGIVCGDPLAAFDILPSLIEACDLDAAGHTFDGTHLFKRLAAHERLPERNIFFEMGKQSAVRSGKWKLTRNGQLVEHGGVVEPTFLADLSRDVGETTNLAGAHPEIVAELDQQLVAWRADLEARWSAGTATRRPG
jgi:arylsulfatase A-like enzyme